MAAPAQQTARCLVQRASFCAGHNRSPVELDAGRHAYTRVTFHDGRVLLTYYEYAEATKRVALKFKSVPVGWFGR